MTRISPPTYLAHLSQIDNKVALNPQVSCLVSTNGSKSKAVVNQLKKMGYEFDSAKLYDPYALQSYPYIEERGEVFVEATHVLYGRKDLTVVRVFSDGPAAPIKAIDIRLYDKPNSARYIAYRLRFDESGSGKFEMERILFRNDMPKLFYRSKERDTLSFRQGEDGLLEVFVKSPTSARSVNMKDIWEEAKDTNLGAEELGRWDSPKPTDCRKNTLPSTQN